MIIDKPLLTQLPLDLSYKKTMSVDNFIPSPCHKEALCWINAYPACPSQMVLIHGEKGCGKTHLAHIFAPYHIEAKLLHTEFILDTNIKKMVVENIDLCTNQEALFHLYNQAMAQNTFVLMTARQLPQFHLNDLKTRISTIPKIHLKMPDDALIKAMLKQLFLDKQIILDDNILEYTLIRMERSFAFLHRLTTKIDTLSLSKNQKITIPLIKQALESLSGIDN